MAKRTKKKIYKNEDSLNPARNTKVRGEFIDYDYKDKLNEEDHAWLAKFNNEFYGASVGYKPNTKKAKAGQLHKKKEQIKGIYDDNNRRNNDVLGVTKANRLLSDVETELKQNDGWYVHDASKQEDALIEAIDNPEEQLLTKEEYEKVKDNLTMEMQLFYEVYFSENMELEGEWEDET